MITGKIVDTINGINKNKNSLNLFIQSPLVYIVTYGIIQHKKISLPKKHILLSDLKRALVKAVSFTEVQTFLCTYQ